MMKRTGMVRCHAFAAAAFACAGCEVAPPTRPVVFTLRPSHAALTAVAATDLVAVSPAATRWQLIDEEGRAIDAPVVAIAAEPSTTCGSSTRVGEPSGDIQFLASSDDGSVLCAAESPGDDAISHFSPALLVAPRQLSPGEAVMSRSSMRVDSTLDDGERDHGSCEQSVRIIGMSRLSTPLGVHEATEVESLFTATLGLTRVRHESHLWSVPGVGVIAQRWRERITVMGVPVRNRGGGAVRLPPAGTRAAASAP